MQNEDCLTRLLLMFFLAGIVIYILPWWLILIFLAPILYSAARLAWKFYQLKRMAEQNDPFRNQQSQQDSYGNGTNNTTSTSSASTTKKKVIADDEGEYVDFEEVKDK